MSILKKIPKSDYKIGLEIVMDGSSVGMYCDKEYFIIENEKEKRDMLIEVMQYAKKTGASGLSKEEAIVNYIEGNYSNLDTFGGGTSEQESKVSHEFVEEEEEEEEVVEDIEINIDEAEEEEVVEIEEEPFEEVEVRIEEEIKPSAKEEEINFKEEPKQVIQNVDTSEIEEKLDTVIRMISQDSSKDDIKDLKKVIENNSGMLMDKVLEVSQKQELLSEIRVNLKELRNDVGELDLRAQETEEEEQEGLPEVIKRSDYYKMIAYMDAERVKSIILKILESEKTYFTEEYLVYLSEVIIKENLKD